MPRHSGDFMEELFALDNKAFCELQSILGIIPRLWHYRQGFWGCDGKAYSPHRGARKTRQENQVDESTNNNSAKGGMRKTFIKGITDL